MREVLELPIEQRGAILSDFIVIIQNAEKIYGKHQILKIIDNIAIAQGFINCPYCGRNDKK